MKYRVYLTTETHRDVECDNEQDAIAKAKAQAFLGVPFDYIATSICKVRDMEEGEDGDDEEDHKNVEGRCEACDKPILEGDEYSVAGEDRYYLCPPCAEEAIKAFQRHVGVIR